MTRSAVEPSESRDKRRLSVRGKDIAFGIGFVIARFMLPSAVATRVISASTHSH